jgi:putative ABC transport system ATP-binding protein
MKEPVIELRSVGKTYGRGPSKVVALDDVTLTLWAGEVVALVGRSGSGKTTLLNIAAGWEPPDAGEMLWQGAPYDVSALGWARVGLVPQSLGLIGEFTLRENVEYPVRLARADAEASRRVEALLEESGIAAIADRFPHQASLGEQQRAAVARALVLDPPIVLLDEPTSHLDRARASELFGELLVTSRRGTCCLIATHARDVVSAATRVLQMEDGHLSEFPTKTASFPEQA